jgi:hypothetical protein
MMEQQDRLVYKDQQVLEQPALQAHKEPQAMTVLQDRPAHKDQQV